ncbi:MAG TPA: hypothetical protein VLG37_03750 [Candidatus Saccharimonadales bacterium]|nr:hypothetical protein [Candidatus Saccharimonadales bacterium]
MRRFIKECLLSGLVFLLAGSLASPIALAADSLQAGKDQACQGISLANGSNGCSNGGDITKVVSAAVQILSIVIGITAVIVIVASGFKYITSGGDAGKVKGAKDTLIYALVGLAVAAFAQFIVHFVLNKVRL